MMKLMRKRLSSDKGFTLIELMVVVLIIAVLIAIAIPSFIGSGTRPGTGRRRATCVTPSSPRRRFGQIHRTTRQRLPA